MATARGVTGQNAMARNKRRHREFEGGCRKILNKIKKDERYEYNKEMDELTYWIKLRKNIVAMPDDDPSFINEENIKTMNGSTATSKQIKAQILEHIEKIIYDIQQRQKLEADKIANEKALETEVGKKPWWKIWG
ncbi:MAG: hypothetical protein ABIH82_00185 [Candidatus Woesearchaeota archaeon]